MSSETFRDFILASAYYGSFATIFLGDVESKPRDLGSDRGYRVMNHSAAATDEAAAAV
jgi:hypothetical protein